MAKIIKFSEIIPVIIVVLVLIYAYLKNVSVFSVFVSGAKKGIDSTLSVLPSLIGMITAITMLNASGAIDQLVNVLSPVANFLYFPAEILPLAILRPISGSAANSVVTNLFSNYGPDSEIGYLASIISASSETSFYVISVYLGSKAYKNLSYLVPVSLLGDFCVVVVAIILTIFVY